MFVVQFSRIGLSFDRFFDIQIVKILNYVAVVFAVFDRVRCVRTRHRHHVDLVWFTVRRSIRPIEIVDRLGLFESVCLIVVRRRLLLHVVVVLAQWRMMAKRQKRLVYGGAHQAVLLNSVSALVRDHGLTAARRARRRQVRVRYGVEYEARVVVRIVARRRGRSIVVD